MIADVAMERSVAISSRLTTWMQQDWTVILIGTQQLLHSVDLPLTAGGVKGALIAGMSVINGTWSRSRMCLRVRSTTWPVTLRFVPNRNAIGSMIPQRI